ncbi:hypothetical protein T11_13551 [Trichinella zimbabwensis]|uniref:Uncharacterized protein n=1 Tax=Trichinella zimbabwensis TaxID=268475 RepID=A0A0V1GYN8_9BILA|nr:hypothetical protein T11_13551 [Trichinella zimbabwensis]
MARNVDNITGKGKERFHFRHTYDFKIDFTAFRALLYCHWKRRCSGCITQCYMALYSIDNLPY